MVWWDGRTQKMVSSPVHWWHRRGHRGEVRSGLQSEGRGDRHSNGRWQDATSTTQGLSSPGAPGSTGTAGVWTFYSRRPSWPWGRTSISWISCTAGGFLITESGEPSVSTKSQNHQVRIKLIIHVLESSSSSPGRKTTFHILPTLSYHLSTQGATTVRERCVCYEELASIPQPQGKGGKRELSFRYEFKVLKVMKLKN